MTVYRVVDLAPADGVDAEHMVTGVTTPEEAGRQALGLELYRSGRKDTLRAKVYFEVRGGAISMVRLYTQAINRA